MKIKHLYHCGFVVEFEEYNTALIFDYFSGEIPTFPVDYRIIFFVSHKHFDHFTKKIFKYAKEYSNITFVLSNDCKMNEKYMTRTGVPTEAWDKIKYMGPWSELEVGTVKISTIKSCDAGVAYIIDAFDKSIYFAGDHNLWKWSEPEDKTAYIKQKMLENLFFAEIDKIVDKHFDVAFLPLDARLGDNFYVGFDAYMRKCDIDKAYPMHMWDDKSVVERLCGMDCSEDYRSRIVKVEAL